MLDNYKGVFDTLIRSILGFLVRSLLHVGRLLQL